MVAFGVVLLLTATGWAGGHPGRMPVLAPHLVAISEPPAVLSASGPPTSLWSPNWRNITTGLLTGPPALHGATVYDGRDGYVLWFGGYGPVGARNETWSFAAGQWTNRTGPGPSPPVPAGGVAMAYDAADGYVVLFTGTSPLPGQTWAYRAGVWTDLTGVVNGTPPARSGAGFTFDTTDQVAVLFGGWDGSSYLADTWTYRAGNWTAVVGSHPSARDAALEVDDPGDFGILLTGGVLGSTVERDTWTFASGSWTNRSAIPAPVLSPGALALGPGGAVLGFGGIGCIGGPLGPCNSTVEYTMGSWRTLSPPGAPSPRAGMTLAYDAVDGMVLGFGGSVLGSALTDTWALGGPVEAALVGGARLSGTDIDVRFDASGQGGYGNYTFAFPNEPTGCFALTPSAIDCGIGVPGNFTINVTVADVFGNQSSASWPLQVYQRLSGQIVSSTNTTDVGVRVLLTASPIGGVGPFAFRWTGLPPGCASADLNVLACTPTAAGFYAVAANITDTTGGSIYTPSVSLAVHPAPLVFASANPITGPAPLAVELTSFPSGGTAPYGYRWDLGDGSISTLANVTYTYPAAGGYLVTLTVTDALQVSTSWTLDHLIVVYAALNVSIDVTAAAWTLGAPVDFTASPNGGVPAYTVEWDYGDGTNASGTAVQHTYRSSGTFTAMVAVTDAAGEVVTRHIHLEIGGGPASAGATPYSGWYDPYRWGAFVLGVVLGIGALTIWRGRGRVRAEPRPPRER